MFKIKKNDLISILIGMSTLVFAFRGKFGAIIIILYSALLFLNLIKNPSLQIIPLDFLWGLFFLIHAIILHFIRSTSFKFYLFIGYLAIIFIFMCMKLENYNFLWKTLKYISIFEALGIYLQKIVPNIYYNIMSTVLPVTVIESIKNRMTNGYYTGFSREISYSMFLIVVGLGLYIFDVSFENHKNINVKNIKKGIIILFLFSALLISGKRATLFFFIGTLFIIYFLKSKSKFKIIKYTSIVIVGIVALYISFPVWSKIKVFQRVVELVNFAIAKDIDGITNGRAAIYIMASDLWEKNKWFGIGWGNFKYSIPDNLWFSGFDVHNCYLQVLCENGIIGAIFYYSLIICCIINFIRTIKILPKINLKHQKLALFAAYMQVFFILYSVTEPILYEYTDYIIFTISVNVTSLIVKDYKKSFRNQNHIMIGDNL